MDERGIGVASWISTLTFAMGSLSPATSETCARPVSKRSKRHPHDKRLDAREYQLSPLACREAAPKSRHRDVRVLSRACDKSTQAHRRMRAGLRLRRARRVVRLSPNSLMVSNRGALCAHSPSGAGAEDSNKLEYSTSLFEGERGTGLEGNEGRTPRRGQAPQLRAHPAGGGR